MRDVEQLAKIRAGRQRLRAGRLRARRIEELGRAFFDGLVIAAATGVGVAVAYGAIWVVFSSGVLVFLLVARALILCSLMGDADQLAGAIDDYAVTLDSWQSSLDERRSR